MTIVRCTYLPVFLIPCGMTVFYLFKALFTVIQSFHPIFVLSHSAVLLHVSLGVPLLFFPSGALGSAVLVLSYVDLCKFP